MRIQYDYECIFCIVDLHAITVYQEPRSCARRSSEIAALYLAAGHRPEAARAIMVQSAVPAHAELAWMLTCVTPVGWLERMTQYKAKAAKQESVGDGLLQYPVLMAADILLYQAAIVPVGEDQSQHLELTRDIAQRFNSLYGETFVVPGTSLPAVGARVMGLDDPDQEDEQVRDRGAPRRGAARSAGEDPQDDHARHHGFAARGGFRLPGRRRARTCSPSTRPSAAGATRRCERHFAGMRYGDLKKQVAEMVVAHLEPFQERYREIIGEPGYLAGVLRGGRRARAPDRQRHRASW